MQSIVKEMIKYVETQNMKEAWMCLKCYKKTEINSTIFEILAWLKLERKREKWISEGKKTCLKPLELKQEYTWCQVLLKLLECDRDFGELFEVVDNKFGFKKEIDECIKGRLREEAFELYNPPKICN